MINLPNAWLSECKRVLKKGALGSCGSYHNIFRVGSTIQDKAMILNDIIWHKTNPMPNFRGTRFTNAHETLLWCTTSREAKYTFNYQNLKELNEGKQMRSDCIYSYLVQEKKDCEKIIINDHTQRKTRSSTYSYFISSTIKAILFLILFMEGTTAVAKLQRNFIGIEKDKDYVKLSKERLKKTKVLKEDVITIAKSRKNYQKFLLVN